MSMCVIKVAVVDYYLENQMIMQRALEKDDILAQEIRNLYRFYFPDSQYTPEMTKRCKEFNEVQKIRKVLRS